MEHRDGSHTNVDEDGNVIGGRKNDHFPNDDSLVSEVEAESQSPECSETVLNEVGRGTFVVGTGLTAGVILYGLLELAELGFVAG